MDALKNEEKTNLDLSIPIYNVNHSSVYKRIEDDFSNNTDYSKEEVILLCDHTYRMEILEVFRMKLFDEAEINKNVHALYNSCKKSKEIMSCAKILTDMENDLEGGFILFFSYDYFYLAHKCIVEFLTNGKVSEGNLNNFLLKVSENSA